jgi:hypothetical protein
LIATPNVDNANRRLNKGKGKKLYYKLRVICMQKGTVVFIFANYLDDILVWNYAISGFKRGIEKAGMGSVPACICVLNSLNSGFRLKIALGSEGGLKIFACVCWSFGRCYDDSFVCLSVA